jgi:GTPase SAR1 family protein
MSSPTSTTTTWTEEDLIETLGSVLLKEEEEDGIEGLDDDLVAYISGLLATQLAEDPANCDDILEESMVPFLESVGCPAHLIGEARQAIRTKANTMAQAAAAVSASAVTTTSNDGATRKLQQGLINMSSTLTDQANDEEDSYLWGAGEQKAVKANANTQMDAYNNNTSAKDRRKQKQELEKFRRELAAQAQQPQDNSTKSGVSTMLLPTIQSKEKDVQLQNITLSLENGTLLMDHGDLKFVYKRRYGLIGENGVGKTTLLSRIANWHELEGFPQHLRVLHVRQELHTENEETSVLQAVLEADIERQTLLDEEQVLLARLEGNESSSSVDGDGNGGGGAASSSSVVSEAETTVTATTIATTITTATTTTIAEKKKRLEGTNDASLSSPSSAFADDLKQLKDVYERLQLLSADTAQSRAAMILSGLQFTPEMQLASIKSLSGGWRMRVAYVSFIVNPSFCFDTTLFGGAVASSILLRRNSVFFCFFLSFPTTQFGGESAH